jgi:ABC-type bacteriocin/lantibiotic exporter with double-glycine peptidase domain
LRGKLRIILCFKKTIKLYAITNQEKQSISSSKIIESLKGIHTIKNLNIEKEIYEDVILKYNDLIDNDFKFNKKYNLVTILKEYIIGGGIILIVFLGRFFIKQEIINISDLIISIFLFNIFTDSVRNLFDLEQLFRLSSNALIRVSEFYDIEEENFYFMEMKRNNIIFDNVSFSYNGIDNIFNNLNIVINDNDKVMITGPSGCGKSTIAKLIIGEYKSDDGKIILGNNDILSYSKKTIRDNTCYISQDEIIFTDSIYNNIKLNRTIEEDEVLKIMNITHIGEIFKKRNLDYHMLIEEDATNLSGGERNRIILARTLLKNSKVIIIDEGTSQMNVKLERHILKNIFENFKDRTIIIITHRIDNSDLFDKIIALDEKRKMEVLM